MGNSCLRRDSSEQWGGDDWGSPPRANNGRCFFTSNKTKHDKSQEKTSMNVNEEKGLLGGNKLIALSSSSSSSPSSTSASSTEVKIKISKKQLQELLSRIDMKELSLEQVLAQWMNVTDRSFETHPGSWRPNLQSIPE